MNYYKIMLDPLLRKYSEVFKGSTIKYSQLKNDIIREQQYNYASAYIKRGKYKDSVYFQTPNMKILDIHKDDRCYIDLQFNEKSSEFFNRINEFDDYNVNTVFKKRKEWFGSTDLSFDTLDDFYQTGLNTIEDDDGNIEAAYIRFYFDNNLGIFNLSKEKITIEDLKVNDNCNCIVEYIGICFEEQKIWPEFWIKQIKSGPEKQSLEFNNYMFFDEEEEFDEESDLPTPDESDFTEKSDIEPDKTNEESDLNTEPNKSIQENKINLKFFRKH